MNLQLIIEGMEVELKEGVIVALTKEFDNLSNVTDIINTWSKTVSVPFTTQNHKVFGEIYRYDKAITTGADIPIGINIDPSRRLEFKLLYNGTVFMSGYAKMNGATMKNGIGTYNLNLFGQLGMVFNELKQLTFDNKNDEIEEKYRLKDYVKDIISKDLVAECWDKAYEDVVFTLENAKTLDFIGFAPTNSGLNSEFDSSTFEVNGVKTQSIKEYIEEKYPNTWGSGATNNLYDLESAIGDGIQPLAIGEYRSYYTQPYVYVPKLFQILQDNCKKLTDYDLKFEPGWFNKENPYYGRMVMLLKNFGTDGVKYDNTLGCNMDGNLAYTAAYYTGSGVLHNRNGKGGLREQDLDQSKVVNIVYDEATSTISPSTPIVDFQQSNSHIIMSDDYSLYASGGAQLRLRVSVNNEIWFDETTIMGIRWNFLGQNGKMETYDSYIFSTRTKIGDGHFGEGTPFKTREDYIRYYYPNPIFLGMNQYVGGYYQWYITLPVGMKMSKSNFGDWVELSINTSLNWDKDNYAPFVQYEGDDGTEVITGLYTSLSITFNGAFSMGVEADASNKRSGDQITLRDLWKNDTTLLDVCLNYTKMYNILWIVDDVEKTVTLMPRYRYFLMENKVLDWTDKLDMTNDYKIEPLLWDTLYAHFNYEDSDTDIGKNFIDRKGYNWGDKKIKLKYEFNNDDKKLFEGIPCSITSTATVLPFTRLCNQNIVFVGSDCVMPNLVSDNSTTDSFGQFYIFNGRRAFDTNLDEIYITDDTSKQSSDNSYCYICPNDRNTRNSVKANGYPLLDITYNDNMSIFAKPSITYDSTNRYENDVDLYTNIWAKQMEGELYNAQNKKITCYLNIKPVDFMQFEHNKFVNIAGQLYLVNKIYDYDISSLNTTKCDLIRVDNVDNYKSINYKEPYYLLFDSYSKKINYFTRSVEFNFDTDTMYQMVTTVSDRRWTATLSNGKLTLNYTGSMVPSVESYSFYVIVNGMSGIGVQANSAKLKIDVVGLRPIDEGIIMSEE